jgi:excisionase family DNA binding protein
VNKLISIKEAAKIAGFSRHTIYRWIKGGILPALKLSYRLVRIDPTKLEEVLMEKKTIKAAANNAGASVRSIEKLVEHQSNLMSRSEMARHIGLDRQKFRRLEKRGLIKPPTTRRFSVSKRTYYKQSDIEGLFISKER